MLLLQLLFAFSITQDDRVTTWKSDLLHFQKEFKTRHVSPFTKLTEAQFDKAISEIDPAQSDDKEIVLKLWRIMAQVGDSHSNVSPPANIAFTQLPFAVMYLSDGWYIFAADKQHQSLLRNKLIQIDDTPIEKACDKLKQLIAAENDSQTETQLKRHLIMNESLRFAEVTSGKEPVKLTVINPDGKQLTSEVKPIKGRANWVMGVKLESWPTHLKNNRPTYGMALLEKEKVLYVWYDQCVNNEKYPITKWTDEVMAKASDGSAEKVIVDLRRNGGGNSRLLEPLITQLAKSPFNTKEKLQVLIGPSTFSSAMINAYTFRLRTKATLIGQPTGGSPNHFGEVRTFTLPSSKCIVQYSTKKFQLTKDGSKTIEPDILVHPTAKGFFADVDEILDKAINLKP